MCGRACHEWDFSIPTTTFFRGGTSCLRSKVTGMMGNSWLKVTSGVTGWVELISIIVLICMSRRGLICIIVNINEALWIIMRYDVMKFKIVFGTFFSNDQAVWLKSWSNWSGVSSILIEGVRPTFIHLLILSIFINFFDCFRFYWFLIYWFLSILLIFIDFIDLFRFYWFFTDFIDFSPIS